MSATKDSTARPLGAPPVALPLKLIGSGRYAQVVDANGVAVIARTFGFHTDKAREAWCRWVVQAANTLGRRPATAGTQKPLVRKED